ncbi:MAG: Dabb family protein [Flavobacteriaceae bacterium]|jgi:antibiotic biosynthesis monooxygenase (ABM) superfamily enzyme|nr:Dabb family protein [Flavobacteriaceae bacterium]
MVHHIVMWKLKNSAEGKTKEENAQIFKERFEALFGVIKEIRTIYIGINMKIAPESNFDVILTTHFDNFDDLNAYANDPHHLKLVEWVKKVIEQRVAIDFER